MKNFLFFFFGVQWTIFLGLPAQKCLSLIIFQFTYQVLNLLMRPKDILVKKPVLQWTALDVAVWVRSLGNWCQGYDERFKESGIDGKNLLSLSESDLENILNINTSFHRRTLINEIESLRNLGVKSPTDFWEYKVPVSYYFWVLCGGMIMLLRITLRRLERVFS